MENVNNSMQPQTEQISQMPDNSQQTQQPQQTQPQNQNMNMAPNQTTSLNYASFGARFAAFFIDTVILGILNSIIVLVAQSLGDSITTIVSLLTTLIGWGYFIYLDVTQGATLGKKAMHLRVQKTDTGENLNYVEAFLREVVGRILSSVVLFLGYFWMLWDKNKQTWHDKIANSIVVKVN